MSEDRERTGESAPSPEERRPIPVTIHPPSWRWNLDPPRARLRGMARRDGRDLAPAAAVEPVHMGARGAVRIVRARARGGLAGSPRLAARPRHRRDPVRRGRLLDRDGGAHDPARRGSAPCADRRCARHPGDDQPVHRAVVQLPDLPRDARGSAQQRQFGSRGLRHQHRGQRLRVRVVARRRDIHAPHHRVVHLLPHRGRPAVPPGGALDPSSRPATARVVDVGGRDREDGRLPLLAAVCSRWWRGSRRSWC